MLGLYNGDPELDSPLLLMAEGRYNYNQDGRLPGTVEIGGWNQFGTLHDQPFASTSPTVAMTSNSVPINSDWAIYGIVDQRVWRVPDSKDANGIGVFGRVIAAPAEQTLIGFYADGGITFSGMIPHRADDILAVGFAYTGISSAAHDFDINSGLPVARTQEVLAEVCYTAKLIGDWTLQPDFQYIWRPGAAYPNPQVKVQCQTRRCGAFEPLLISDSPQAARKGAHHRTKPRLGNRARRHRDFAVSPGQAWLRLNGSNSRGS
jgi:porin